MSHTDILKWRDLKWCEDVHVGLNTFVLLTITTLIDQSMFALLMRVWYGSSCYSRAWSVFESLAHMGQAEPI